MSPFWFVRRPPCLPPRRGQRVAESPSAGRTVTPKRPALIPATSARRCSKTPERAPSSSDIRSGACITARPALVARKALAARRAGLIAILCVGETQQQRASGAALSICGGQIVASVPIDMTGSALAIDYEPLWVIGSGQIPTSQEIVHMHAHIRRCLVEHLGAEGKCVRILYGGSVKPSNARTILALPEVGGALVGDASLKSEEFSAIFASAPAEGATMAAE